MMLKKKFFRVTEQKEWKVINDLFIHGYNHKDAIGKIDQNTKRVYNDRFREIEKTGHFYYVKENIKGGKCFIFEKLN